MRHFTLKIAISTLIALVLAVVLIQAAQAQTFQVIYNFGQDGSGPMAGVTIDRGGNLYGTTQGGGTYNQGLAYKLTNKNGGWVLSPLYSFAGNNKGTNDGIYPYSRVVFGPDGSLYGTTNEGGGTESLPLDLRPALLLSAHRRAQPCLPRQVRRRTSQRLPSRHDPVPRQPPAHGRAACLCSMAAGTVPP